MVVQRPWLLRVNGVLPVVGIGYTQEVNGHTYFLHDGRALNVLEAVLWHGGEAQASRDKVLQFDKAQREALVAF